MYSKSNIYFRVEGKCKAGARTATCCAHVAATIYASGFLAYNPQAWQTRWREFNFVDAGANPAYNADILNGCFT